MAELLKPLMTLASERTPVELLLILGVTLALVISLMYLMVKIDSGDFERGRPSNRTINKAFKEVGYNQSFTVDKKGKITKQD